MAFILHHWSWPFRYGAVMVGDDKQNVGREREYMVVLRNSE